MELFEKILLTVGALTISCLFALGFCWSVCGWWSLAFGVFVEIIPIAVIWGAD